MIQKYVIKERNEEVVYYRVRVGQRSRRNPAIRVSKQEGCIPTESQAIKREAQLKKVCEREVFDRDAKGIIFSDLVASWYIHFEKIKVATGQRSKIVHDDYRAGIAKWFRRYWNRPATEINPYVIAEVFEDMKTKDVCFGHRKKIKQILKSIFDYGIQSGMLAMPRSPTFEVMLRNDIEKKPEILTVQEIQILIGKAYESNHEWRRIWFAALATGMRSGELQALEWSDVSFETGLLNVNKSYNCRTRSFKSTKSGMWRQVPISDDLLRVLKDQQKETGDAKHVFPRNWEWDKGFQARVLRKFCFLYGLPSIKFHTLRACFATQMLQSGVEAAKVMKICGWKELKTMQHYVRLAGIEVQGATNKLRIFSDQLKSEL